MTINKTNKKFFDDLKKSVDNAYQEWQATHALNHMATPLTQQQRDSLPYMDVVMRSIEPGKLMN